MHQSCETGLYPNFSNQDLNEIGFLFMNIVKVHLFVQ